MISYFVSLLIEPTTYKGWFQRSEIISRSSSYHLSLSHSIFTMNIPAAPQKYPMKRSSKFHVPIEWEEKTPETLRTPPAPKKAAREKMTEEVVVTIDWGSPVEATPKTPVQRICRPGTPWAPKPKKIHPLGPMDVPKLVL